MHAAAQYELPRHGPDGSELELEQVLLYLSEIETAAIPLYRPYMMGLLETGNLMEIPKLT